MGALAPDTPMGYPCIQYNIPPWGICQGDNSIVGCRRSHNRWAGSTLGRTVCSPLPANPYIFVPGSKIFTKLPTPKRSFAGKSASPFAPRSPLTLVASSRGAKSSHSRRRFSPFRPPGGLRLFAPRSPLSLVSPSRGAKSSHNFRPLSAVSPANRPVPLLPPPANPCGFVPGSKIFTQLPVSKRSFAGKSASPFAPRSPLTLVASSRGAKSSHSRRRFSPFRPPGGLRPLLPVPL